MAALHGNEPPTNRYSNRYSTTLTASQHLRLAQEHRPSTRKRLSGGLEKLKCKARRVSAEFCKSLHPQQKMCEEQLLGRGNIITVQHDAPEVELHLCSVSDCDHMFCLPAIPKDYDRSVGHGVEDDHSSIDYDLESSVHKSDEWQQEDDYEIIEPENPELNAEAFRGFSGAWPQDLLKNSSPIPKVIRSEKEQQEGSLEASWQTIGTSSPAFLSGCGPDPEPTQWLDLPPEALETAEWLGRLWRSFADESGDGACK